LSDGLITLGFLGLMVIAIGYFIKVFPEALPAEEKI
jgi:hypothetical protein